MMLYTGNMHLRFRHCIGLPIYEDDPHALPIGTIANLLIEPDTGNIEGFFVRPVSWFASEHLYLRTVDILSWHKNRILINDHSAVGPLADVIRAQELYNQKRPIMGQRIVSENGQQLGTCRDVQFNDTHGKIEWLFPRKFWRWQNPLPTSEIIEVTKQAIVIKSEFPIEIATEQQQNDPVAQSLTATAEPALPRV